MKNIKGRRDSLRRSVSSSTILLATDNKLKASLLQQQQQHHPLTDLPTRHSPLKMDLLKAMPPPPLMDDTERDESDDILHAVEKDNNNNNNRRELLSQSKRVSFSSKSKCVFIESRTQAEKDASFYSQAEYKRIYSENIDTIRKMESSSSSSKNIKLAGSTNQYYFRGLLVPRARYEREQRIKFVVSKVLREQEKHKTLADDWVRDFSQQFSKQTAIAALVLAKIDALAAGAKDIRLHHHPSPAVRHSAPTHPKHHHHRHHHHVASTTRRMTTSV